SLQKSNRRGIKTTVLNSKTFPPSGQIPPAFVPGRFPERCPAAFLLQGCPSTRAFLPRNEVHDSTASPHMRQKPVSREEALDGCNLEHTGKSYLKDTHSETSPRVHIPSSQSAGPRVQAAALPPGKLPLSKKAKNTLPHGLESSM